MTFKKTQSITFKVLGLLIKCFHVSLFIDREIEECHGRHDIENVELEYKSIKVFEDGKLIDFETMDYSDQTGIRKELINQMKEL